MHSHRPKQNFLKKSANIANIRYRRKKSVTGNHISVYVNTLTQDTFTATSAQVNDIGRYIFHVQKAVKIHVSKT